jgi:hypothetical protein
MAENASSQCRRCSQGFRIAVSTWAVLRDDRRFVTSRPQPHTYTGFESPWKRLPCRNWPESGALVTRHGGWFLKPVAAATKLGGRK